MREQTFHRPRMPLWLALGGPAAVWMGHLLVTYGLVYVTCRPGGRVWFVVATVLALAAIAPVLLSTRPDPGRYTGGVLSSWTSVEGGRETMHMVAWLLAGFFLLVTLMAGVGMMLVSPCL